MKILHKSLVQTQRSGLEQTWQYMDRSKADEGHLVIFDRSADKSWDEKLFQCSKVLCGKTIWVWGM